MVIYEAAHAIVQLKNTTAKDLAPAVSVLQLFCSSPKPTLRFAAVRTLNKVIAYAWSGPVLNVFLYEIDSVLQWHSKHNRLKQFL